MPGFGDEGMINLRTGVNGDKFPRRFYGMSSPPSIYKNLVITGANTGEMPAHGPWGDVRAWDMRNGKLVWTFHTIPRPGEPHHEEWREDQWQDRSGANSWGIITVDTQRGMVFLPVGTPTTDFYGGDRLGSNLYGSSVVALDAATGKVKWFFQTTHHDNWDYDPTAAPALITVKHKGRTIPAVAQITKQGLLFILDRDTGKPIYGVEERPVVSDNTIPGDEPWPTQPVPLKPPPLSRNTFTPDEIATVTPEHEKYCRDLLAREGGALTGGPFAQYGPKLRVIFPSWTGGPNWGGITFDPRLGYIFLNTKHLANFNKMVKSADGTTWNRVPPDNPPVNIGEDFRDGTKHWPCQKPPWGEMIAVNANTGEIAWRVPLGSFEELDKLGVPKTGTPTTNGGSTSTAGGLVFTGVSMTASSAVQFEDGRRTVDVLYGRGFELGTHQLSRKRREAICCGVRFRRRSQAAASGAAVRLFVITESSADYQRRNVFARCGQQRQLARRIRQGDCRAHVHPVPRARKYCCLTPDGDGVGQCCG